MQDYGYLLVSAIVLALVIVLLVLLWLWLWRGGGRKMPPTAAHAYLVSSEAPNVIFPIVKDSVTIGRAKGCDIQITEKMKLPGADTLSRWHARLEKRGERWVLIDGVKPNQPSTNGVFVNGMRTRENYLREGVEIRLGQVAFTFYTQLPTAQPAQGGAR
jgi:pSer/pThr/pTyr-binding forkhead associated (FHA) protein